MGKYIFPIVVIMAGLLGSVGWADKYGDWEVKGYGGGSTQNCSISLDNWKYKIYFSKFRLEEFGRVSSLTIDRNILGLGSYWPINREKGLTIDAKQISVNKKPFFAIWETFFDVIQIVQGNSDEYSQTSRSTAIRFFKHLSDSNEIEMSFYGKTFLKTKHKGLDRAFPHFLSRMSR